MTCDRTRESRAKVSHAGGNVSHFTKAKTKLTDARLIQQALARLDYEVLEGTSVAGWRGKTTKAEFKVKSKGNSNHEIGFLSTSTGYDLTSDWSLNGTNKEIFLRELSMAYGREAAVESLESQGFRIEEEHSSPSTIRIVFRR